MHPFAGSVNGYGEIESYPVTLAFMIALIFVQALMDNECLPSNRLELHSRAMTLNPTPSDGYRTRGPLPPIVPMVITSLAAAAPLLAMASESYGGLAPCALCLMQRWPYWIGAAIAAVACLIATRPRRSRIARGILALSGLTILASAAVAAVHLGVEWHWWASPISACMGVTGIDPSMTVDDLMKTLVDRPAKPCDMPDYLIPGVPVSMSGMNFLYASVLGGLTLYLSGANRLIPGHRLYGLDR